MICTYKIEIFSNKLIALKRLDTYNKNEGVLRRYYVKSNTEKVQIDDIMLYIPKGKNELEVIWYMNFIKGANP